MSIEKEKSRIAYIDFLKFIGITAIIIAHVGSPNWLMALRSFDVPFMVILSAILGTKSYLARINNEASVLDYYVSRFKRLVFPTWLFLLFYFGVALVMTGTLQEVKYYVASFALTRYGIGYVWVILIYLYSALLIPLFSKVKLSSRVTLCVFAVYAIYELAYYLQIGIDNKIIDTTFYYFIPYGVLTYLGCNYYRFTNKQRNIIAALSSAIVVVLGGYYWMKFGAPQLFSAAKYPPRLYYLSFGVAVSFLLLIIFEKYTLKVYNNICVRFISKNSLWIYLWHIFTLSIYKYLKLPEIWYLKLLVVYVSAIGIAWVVRKIVTMIEIKKQYTVLKYITD